MADTLVTVMTFRNSFEARLAKNLLENEGIVSSMTDELTSDGLFGAGLPQQVSLLVHENDAQRAVALLAEVELNKNWEDEAESGSDVWICSICGEPISNRLSICFACQTPRESIRDSLPHDRVGIQVEPPPPSIGEAIQKPDK